MVSARSLSRAHAATPRGDYRGGPPTGEVAVFVDMENLGISLAGRGLRVNPRRLREAAARFGRVAYAKAYADWQEGRFVHDPPVLYAAGIEPVYVPTSLHRGEGNGAPQRKKNSVDVRMAIDITEMALTLDSVSTFVLVTGDGDFIHLVYLLQAYGKTVVVIGASWTASRLLVGAADGFLAYDGDVIEAVPAAGVVAPAPAGAEDSPTLRDLFAAVVDDLRVARDRGLARTFSAIKTRLVDRLGAFDTAPHGYPKFKAFMHAAAARGLIRTTSVGLVDWACLPDEDPAAVAAQAPASAATEPTTEELAAFLAAVVPVLARAEADADDRWTTFSGMVNAIAAADATGQSKTRINWLLSAVARDDLFLVEQRPVTDAATGAPRAQRFYRLNPAHPAVGPVATAPLEGATDAAEQPQDDHTAAA